MANIDARLAELGIDIPDLVPPVGCRLHSSGYSR